MPTSALRTGCVRADVGIGPYGLTMLIPSTIFIHIRKR